LWGIAYFGGQIKVKKGRHKRPKKETNPGRGSEGRGGGGGPEFGGESGVVNELVN